MLATSSSSATSCGGWVLIATILASGMAFIDGTVVNVALPALQAAMGASVSSIQWIVESYALSLAALLLPGGSLGDIYGRRRVFASGVALFCLASIWCGLAPNVQQLIAARALQGAGAALLIPGSLALISTSFREEERGRAIGTWSGRTAITAAVGPICGGWLVQHAAWCYDNTSTHILETRRHCQHKGKTVQAEYSLLGLLRLLPLRPTLRNTVSRVDLPSMSSSHRS